MRIAYLINKYPAVSHSFIRREIREMEALGAAVTRVTIRPPADDLPDDQDKVERDLTISILGQGFASILAAAFLSILTGPERAARGIAVALKMSGWHPRLILRHLAYFAEAAWLVKHLRKERVDQIHAHFGTNPAAVARIVHHLGGFPYSFTVHGPDEFDSPAALDIAGKVADSAAAVAISSFGRSQLMRWSSPRDWHKISVVRCGLDEGFLEAPVSPPAVEPRLCCVARLSAQKGLPLLVEACSLLKARGAEFSLTLVGEGELRRDLEERVAELGLAREVLFVGAQDANGVRNHLAESRAFVLPSFAEGLPVVLMEALALGRPAISTRIAGIPELVDDQCGWLIPAGSVEALADAMADALGASLEHLTELGSVGRSRVLAMHSAKRNAAQLLELIRPGPGGVAA